MNDRIVRTLDDMLTSKRKNNAAAVVTATLKKRPHTTGIFSKLFGNDFADFLRPDFETYNYDDETTVDGGTIDAVDSGTIDAVDTTENDVDAIDRRVGIVDDHVEYDVRESDDDDDDDNQLGESLYVVVVVCLQLPFTERR